MGDEAAKLRVDKWLWYARFVKTRGLAAKLVTGGHLRVNGAKTLKAAQGVGPGDVLTFPQGRVIRVVRIIALAERRGPAPEAQALYEDLTPEAPPRSPSGGPRPTKRDRREIEAFRGKD